MEHRDDNMLMTDPTATDLWLITRLASGLGKHPLFDAAVQSGIRLGVLGGFCFAAALFHLAVRAGAGDARQERIRLATTFVGSVLAALVTVLLAHLVKWPPPNRYSALASSFPRYLERNHNLSSFPSQSTAVCAAIAAGITSLWRVPGGLLWVAVVLLVALPRIYVGGHYPTDVVAGFATGLVGYSFARWLEPVWASGRITPLQPSWRLRTVATFVLFVWILEVGTEFQAAAWLRRSMMRYTSSNPVRIGGDSFFGQYFQGRIDNVRIYNHALSPFEIQQDMETPVGGGKAASRSGLVAAYSFDEGAGQTAHDSSGYNNDGTVFSTTWTSEGKFGGALLFDGVRSWVTIKDSPSLHMTLGITLEAWVYPTAVPTGWQDIIYKETDVYYLTAGSIQNVPATGGTFFGSGTQSVFGPAPLPVSTWTHLAGTYDGSRVRLYLNGTEVSSRPQTGPLFPSSRAYFLK